MPSFWIQDSVFGKNYQHNIELFQAIPALCELGFPLMIGLSRKSMLARITGKPVNERISASVMAAVLAARSGASILRVHDVNETVDALKTATALAQFFSNTEKLFTLRT